MIQPPRQGCSPSPCVQSELGGFGDEEHQHHLVPHFGHGQFHPQRDRTDMGTCMLLCYQKDTSALARVSGTGIRADMSKYKL